jgi:hypothetical protein
MSKTKPFGCEFVKFSWAHMMALVEKKSKKWPRNVIPHGEKVKKEN